MSKHVALTLAAALLVAACSGSATPVTSSDSDPSSSSPASTTTTSAPSTTSTTTAAPTTSAAHTDPRPEAYRLEIVDVLPHDPSAFTQGLLIRDGLLYESTGQYGSSEVRVVDLNTGEVLRSRSLPGEFFGEGLELVDGQIVQLTWLEGTAFVWDAETLEERGEFSYEGEGWGLCSRDGAFVMSDGSARLTVRDLETFEAVRTIDVTYEGEPVDRLNELECTETSILANVWRTDLIVVIDPETGIVDARIDAGALREQLSSTEGIDVLNGIAHDAGTDRYYLTGKYWPDLFVVRLIPDG